MVMTVGYARVSTGNQRLDMQLDALKASGCTRVYNDTASGALSARPGLDQATASDAPYPTSWPPSTTSPSAAST